ncbi:Conserved_hypothetical protein [Hexamita inflata]|uniref:Uncharacterized protein n=1 Tax=Hexamita inflata TaxID=28002 RepID=A0AA86N8N9_9EUKA|nr:Conserved hypothetical protein [Hexamita inflata]
MQIAKGSTIINEIKWMYEIANFIQNYKNTDEYKSNSFSSGIYVYLDLLTHSNQIFSIQFQNGLASAQSISQPDISVVKSGEIFLLGLSESSEFLKLEIACQQVFQINQQDNDIQDSKTAEALLIRELIPQQPELITGYLDKATCERVMNIRTYTDAVLQPMTSLLDLKCRWEKHQLQLSGISENDEFEVIDGFQRRQKQFGSLEAFKYLKQNSNQYVAIRMFSDLKQCLLDLCDMSVINQCCFKQDVIRQLQSDEFNLECLMNKPHVQLLERITQLHQMILQFKNSPVKFFDYDYQFNIVQNKFKKTQIVLNEQINEVKIKLNSVQISQENMVKRFQELFQTEAEQ